MSKDDDKRKKEEAEQRLRDALKAEAERVRISRQADQAIRQRIADNKKRRDDKKK